MAQACDKYTKTSLMGNWYEERLAPDQPFRDQLDVKTMRGQEEAISFASSTQQLLPLARVKRNHPWDTKGLIADDGFREYRSETNTRYDPISLKNFYGMGDCRQITKHYTAERQFPESNPTQIQTKKSNTFSQLNLGNTHHIHVERSVPTNVTDFGSTFKKFPESHEKFYGMSTYQQSFSRPLQDTAQQIINSSENNANRYSGINERPYNLQSTKMTSVLTAEKYKNGQDPKENTQIQRSWMPYKDKAVLAAERNLARNVNLNETKGLNPSDPLITYKSNIYQVQDHDIATSLPIGKGEYYDQKRMNQIGEFRHIRSDVTTIRNSIITKK